MEYAVISVIGPDRVGIVDTLAETVAAAGANIEETRASILGGEFAVIMLVTGTEGIAKTLASSLPEHGRTIGLTITVKPTHSPAQPAGLPYLIESLSLDTPGIVRAVSGVLKERGINIEDLETNVGPAPLSGSPMFSMRICVNIVPGAQLAALKADLAKAGVEYDLDIDVHPLK